ncbi:MAG TPA: hypothetical protein VNN80_27140, partial [Polyangiaceae bacterium]|nr:hypothetical protein [Polyangiaceae bacterium]
MLLSDALVSLEPPPPLLVAAPLPPSEPSLAEVEPASPPPELPPPELPPLDPPLDVALLEPSLDDASALDDAPSLLASAAPSEPESLEPESALCDPPEPALV